MELHSQPQPETLPRLAVGVAVALAGLTLPIVPLATWMLPPETYVAYEKALGIKPQKAEVHHEGALPQPIGDQFGWPELTREVAENRPIYLCRGPKFDLRQKWERWKHWN